MKKQRTATFGLNLGGWLLVERWMTPSLFEGTDAEDEYTLMRCHDGPRRIAQHRQSFITEQDWQWLDANHIRLVRVPVGYWVLRDDSPYTHAKKHLDWAFQMAEKYNIHIILDLHGLKGSQNGTIHSGSIGSVGWEEYEADHLRTLKELARRYRDSTSLWGLEIINEPKVIGHYRALRSFYRRAYDMLCRELNPGTKIIFQDGFAPLLFSGIIRPKKSHPVVMDTHFYLIGGTALGWLSPQMYDRIRGAVYRSILFFCQIHQPVIVGEWSSVLPQKMFNRTPQIHHGSMVAKTIHRQKNTYAAAEALCYWNYKAEGRGMYHYRSLVEDGLI